MKIKVPLAPLCFFVLHSGFCLSALAQGTAFTYQGRLLDNGSPASGIYDLQFTIYDSTNDPGTVIAGPLTHSTAPVSNGLFTVTLDFGEGVFDGNPRWLEIGVRTNAGASFIALTPRQQLTPTPYAIYAANAGTAVSATSVASNAVGPSELQSSAVTSEKIADGTITPADLDSASFSNLFWKMDGNVGTAPATHFLGTTDNQPLEVRVNNQRALRLEPTEFSPNVIGGHASNIASNGVGGAFIGGGGNTFFPNRVEADFASVVGGSGNTASGWVSTAMGAGTTASDYGSTAMGAGTTASGEVSTAMGLWTTASGVTSMAMGQQTTASGTNSTAMGYYSIASGDFATAMGGGAAATGYVSTAMGWLTTAGGTNSTAMGYQTTASGNFSTAMGAGTTASGTSSTAMGAGTTASGSRSAAMGLVTTASGFIWTAMGYRANASHDCSFVWADCNEDADFPSTAPNQFNIRARGGVRLENQTSLHFGARPRQMLNLFETVYGIGVQDYAQYFRTGRDFFWYRGGSHQDGNANPGGGSTLMWLNESGDLSVTRGVWATAFNQSSDRDAKAQFQAVNPREVLNKVTALPISRWVFKTDPATRHLGPMAQDFHTAFGLGTDDKHIATVDVDGVALAAIQGLNFKLEEQLQQKEAQLASQQQQIAELIKRLESLERKLTAFDHE